MHNKSLTADNQASILGGRNIGDEYFDATLEVGFTDMDTLCIGPVVPEVSAAFDLYWNSRWVYPLRALVGESYADAKQVAAYRKALVRGGVELYEFKPLASSATATDDGRSRWRGLSRASLHGKFIGFDRRYLFVGSFNVDGRSVALNTEQGVFLESPEYASNLSSDFDQRAMVLGYRVVLTEQGDLQWVTLEDGEEMRFDVEPETGYWTRFSTRVMSVFVPESQL